MTKSTEERLASLETNADNLKADITEIKQTLVSMNENLVKVLAGRPSWAVTTTLGMLSTALGVCITIIFSLLGR